MTKKNRPIIYITATTAFALWLIFHHAQVKKTPFPLDSTESTTDNEQAVSSRTQAEGEQIRRMQTPTIEIQEREEFNSVVVFKTVQDRNKYLIDLINKVTRMEGNEKIFADRLTMATSVAQILRDEKNLTEEAKAAILRCAGQIIEDETLNADIKGRAALLVGRAGLTELNDNLWAAAQNENGADLEVFRQRALIALSFNYGNDIDFTDRISDLAVNTSSAKVLGTICSLLTRQHTSQAALKLFEARHSNDLDDMVTNSINLLTLPIPQLFDDAKSDLPTLFLNADHPVVIAHASTVLTYFLSWITHDSPDTRLVAMAVAKITDGIRKLPVNEALPHIRAIRQQIDQSKYREELLPGLNELHSVFQKLALTIP